MDSKSRIAEGLEKLSVFTHSRMGLYPMLGVLGVSAILRYTLAIVNREANDPHDQVVRIILRESRLPHAGETWESFQPKLFHWTMAQGIRLLGLTANDAQTVFMQIMNTTVGILVLLCVFFFLRRLPIAEPVRFWSLALMAFNPKLIGIDAQATNDAFVFLFASLAILAAVEFFRTDRFGCFILLIVATILAGLSKGNGLVVFVALLGVWILRMAVGGWRKGRRFIFSSLLFLGVWLSAFFLIVPYFGQYIQRYRENGSPFVTNLTPDPLPSLFARSETGRPGVVSFSESYLSFPIINLLETPMIVSQEDEINPANRTSLWAQIYGRANFAHFDQWPESWQTDNPIILDIGRCILVLALLPTLAGALCFLFNIVKNSITLLTKAKFEEEPWVHTLVLGGYILFVMLYAWEYRNFNTMKAIFIFPALISMGYFIGNGLQAVYMRVTSRLFRSIMHLVLGSLVFFYILDISYLILQLAHDRQWL